MPKHEGHATVASRALQCAHCVASLADGAPHIGQLRVAASMPKAKQSAPSATTRFVDAVNAEGVR